MTWRELVVVRVLLLVAMIVGKDPRLQGEIVKLTNHIVVTAREQERLAA